MWVDKKERDSKVLLYKSQILIIVIDGLRTLKIVKSVFGFFFFFYFLILWILHKPVFGVGGGGCGFGLFPNVVSAVELTPNSTMKTAKSIVRLPHCVNRLSGSICWCCFLFLSLSKINCTNA